MRARLPKRGWDRHGNGAYGAPRGDRTHEGIDYAVWPGSEVESPVEGTVTKRGYPYADDLSWRYIEVTCPNGERVRVFYVEPFIGEGRHVSRGTVLGIAQDLRDRYPGITPHIHVEVIVDEEYINPESFL